MMRRCPQCGSPAFDSHQFCPACGGDLAGIMASNEEDAYLGLTIAGKFILRQLIGTGGMGRVYLSDQIGVGRTVAVKIMHRHLLGDETAAARFTNEARASSQLNHPNSISVLDFGQTEVGILYIVMEYLRGKSLDIILQQEFPIPFGRIANVLCQALEAVEAAHELNIIHRDLKPENVFLEQSTGYDFVKVLDFGVAKMLDIPDRSITTPGLVPGTPEYMSPEQARGESLDPRSDVYSMGVILYELITGTAPFKGASALATMMSHVQDPPEPPSLRSPGRRIPKALDSIVLWALAKDKSKRISSADQFREVLAAWAEVTGLWPVEEKRRQNQAKVLRQYLPANQVEHLSLSPRQEVLKPSSPALKRVPRQRTPLEDPQREAVMIIGRLEEKTHLQKFLEAERPGRVLRIQGNVGMGKASLVKEAASMANELGFEIIHCRPSPGWARVIVGLAQKVAIGCLKIDETTYEPEDILVAAGILGLDADDLPGLKELFGLSTHISALEPESRRRERSAAFRHLVHQTAAAKQLLLIFEEIEQYDDPSQELILSLIAAPCVQPLAIIVTHSPNFTQLWPPEVESLNLSAMKNKEIAKLVNNLFDEGGDIQLGHRIAQTARGRPLFAEQASFAEVNEGITEFPEKTADLVAARVDRLPQEQRQYLQWISVHNRWVSPEVLTELMEGQPVDVDILKELNRKGYLKESLHGYAFDHHLLTMVVYSSIPVEVRRRIHHNVAKYLRRMNAPVAAIAFHSYEADDGVQAVEELDRAGIWALKGLDPVSAVKFYSRAIEVIRREWGKGRVAEGQLDQMAVDLARRLAEVLGQTGDSLAAKGVLEETLSVAGGDSESRASLRLDLGRIDLNLGNFQRAIRHLELAQADVSGGNSDWLLGEVTRELARAVGLAGDPERAGQIVFESFAASTRASGQHGSPSWGTLLAMATTCSQIGLKDRARGYLLDALQLADNKHSVPGKLDVLTHMADVHLTATEWSEAEIRLNQALDQVVQVGDRTRKVKFLTDLGRLHRIQGKVEEGRKSLESAVKVARSIGWWEGLKRAESEIEMLKYAIPQAL